MWWTALQEVITAICTCHVTKDYPKTGEVRTYFVHGSRFSVNIQLLATAPLMAAQTVTFREFSLTYVPAWALAGVRSARVSPAHFKYTLCYRYNTVCRTDEQIGTARLGGRCCCSKCGWIIHCRKFLTWVLTSESFLPLVSERRTVPVQYIPRVSR